MVNSELETRYILYFLLRSGFLFGLVYWFTSTIPQTQQLETRVRMTISLMVVIVYSLVDAIWGFTLHSKKLACQFLCPKK